MDDSRAKRDVTAYGEVLDQLGDKVAPPDPYAEEIVAAWQLHTDNKNEAALSGFEKILQKDPNHMDALYGKGLALRALGRREDAIAAFEKLINLIDSIRADMPGRSTILERLARRQIKSMREG